MSEGKDRFAWVPAWIINDPSISRDARWLFTLMASHANKNDHLTRSLAAIARQEGVATRTVERWRDELERAGYIAVQPIPGRSSVYRIIRDRDKVEVAREYNAKAKDGRSKFVDHGRKGAAVRAEGRVHPRQPCRPTPDIHVGSTPDIGVAPPPTPVSPITILSEHHQDLTAAANSIPLPSGSEAIDEPIALNDAPFHAPSETEMDLADMMEVDRHEKPSAPIVSVSSKSTTTKKPTTTKRRAG